MQRYLLTIAIAAFMLIVSPAAGGSQPDKEDATEVVPVAVQNVAIPWPGVRDEAAMVLIGTALIGLAALVRRAA